MSKADISDMLTYLANQPSGASHALHGGLIVRESGSDTSFEKVVVKVRDQVETEVFEYDGTIEDGEVLARLDTSIRKGVWPLVHVTSNPSNEFIAGIKSITQGGSEAGESKANLLVFADRDFIEKSISYPFFYRLFGPVCAV
jgi:hypothetical protein